MESADRTVTNLRLEVPKITTSTQLSKSVGRAHKTVFLASSHVFGIVSTNVHKKSSDVNEHVWYIDYVCYIHTRAPLATHIFTAFYYCRASGRHLKTGFECDIQTYKKSPSNYINSY